MTHVGCVKKDGKKARMKLRRGRGRTKWRMNYLLLKERNSWWARKMLRIGLGHAPPSLLRVCPWNRRTMEIFIDGNK